MNNVALNWLKPYSYNDLPKPNTGHHTVRLLSHPKSIRVSIWRTNILFRPQISAKVAVLDVSSEMHLVKPTLYINGPREHSQRCISGDLGAPLSCCSWTEGRCLKFLKIIFIQGVAMGDVEGSIICGGYNYAGFRGTFRGT